jgi:hypothetical protein
MTNELIIPKKSLARNFKSNFHSTYIQPIASLGLILGVGIPSAYPIVAVIACALTVAVVPPLVTGYMKVQDKIINNKNGDDGINMLRTSIINKFDVVVPEHILPILYKGEDAYWDIDEHRTVAAVFTPNGKFQTLTITETIRQGEITKVN